MFEMSTVFLAAILAEAKTGKRMAARIAIIAITTKSSISVNAFFISYECPPGNSSLAGPYESEVELLREHVGYVKGRLNGKRLKLLASTNNPTVAPIAAAVERLKERRAQNETTN